MLMSFMENFRGTHSKQTCVRTFDLLSEWKIRQQAITWTNVDHLQRHLIVSLGLNELMQLA